MRCGILQYFAHSLLFCLEHYNFYFPLRNHSSFPNPIKPQSSHHQALTPVEAISQLLPVKRKTDIISYQQTQHQQHKQQHYTPQVDRVIQECVFLYTDTCRTFISLHPYFRTAIHLIIVILKAFQVRTVWKMQIPSTAQKIPIYLVHLTHRSPEQAQRLSQKLLSWVITHPIQENSTAISRKNKRLWSSLTGTSYTLFLTTQVTMPSERKV